MLDQNNGLQLSFVLFGSFLFYELRIGNLKFPNFLKFPWMCFQNAEFPGANRSFPTRGSCYAQKPFPIPRKLGIARGWAVKPIVWKSVKNWQSPTATAVGPYGILNFSVFFLRKSTGSHIPRRASLPLTTHESLTRNLWHFTYALYLCPHLFRPLSVCPKTVIAFASWYDDSKVFQSHRRKREFSVSSRCFQVKFPLRLS